MEDNEISRIWKSGRAYHVALLQMITEYPDDQHLSWVKENTVKKISGKMDDVLYTWGIYTCLSIIDDDYKDALKHYGHGVKMLGVLPENEREPYLAKLDEAKKLITSNVSNTKKKVIRLSKVKSIDDVFIKS